MLSRHINPCSRRPRLNPLQDLSRAASLMPERRGSGRGPRGGRGAGRGGRGAAGGGRGVNKAEAGRGRGRGGRGGKSGGRDGGKKPTKEQLDKELDAYLMKDDETKGRVVAAKKQALDEELDKYLAKSAEGDGKASAEGGEAAAE